MTLEPLIRAASGLVFERRRMWLIIFALMTALFAASAVLSVLISGPMH